MSQERLGRAAFKQLWESGMGYVEMAKVIGVSKTCLCNWRKELNLPRRKTGPRRLE